MTDVLNTRSKKRLLTYVECIAAPTNSPAGVQTPRLAEHRQYASRHDRFSRLKSICDKIGITHANTIRTTVTYLILRVRKSTLLSPSFGWLRLTLWGTPWSDWLRYRPMVSPLTFREATMQKKT